MIDEDPLHIAGQRAGASLARRCTWRRLSRPFALSKCGVGQYLERAIARPGMAARGSATQLGNAIYTSARSASGILHSS
jgi:hypothetical protein